MLKTTKLAPLNSLLFIEDAAGGRPPQPIFGALINSTPSCISFACFPVQDGPTEIVIGQSDEVKPGPILVFNGYLETPSRVVIISGVEIERVLSVAVAHPKTEVKIWYNHPRWPDKVTIALA